MKDHFLVAWIETKASPHLETLPVAAVQLQQALSAASAGRRHGEGLLHVDHPLTQPPLKTVRLVELFHLQRPERTAVTSAAPRSPRGRMRLCLVTTCVLASGLRGFLTLLFLNDRSETALHRSTTTPRSKNQKLLISNSVELKTSATSGMKEKTKATSVS